VMATEYQAARILLVDDEQQVIAVMKSALARGGYDVKTATSGRRALELLETEPLPDLLILDLNMPEPDGFELLRRERAKYPDLRILVISGYLQGTMLEAAKVFGAVATLQKPFSPQVLVLKVREILGE
jgi:CheY-like chemotaxis protein